MTNESRPRMMPVHSPILQVQQNLRDAEKRIEELTAAQGRTWQPVPYDEGDEHAGADAQTFWYYLGDESLLCASRLNDDGSETEVVIDLGTKWRMCELSNKSDRVAFHDAYVRIDELTTALHQLVAQINSSVSVISDSLRQDGDAYTVNVSTLAALGHMRDDVLKVLNNASADGGNLRDLLNKSMVENVELLRQVVSMQEALYEAQGALLSANKRIDELTKELADAQASHHSAMFLLDEAQSDCNGWHDAYVALLWWSQDAYRKLAYHATLFPVPEIADMLEQESNADIVALLSDAPANVSAEVDPFSATVDADLGVSEKADKTLSEEEVDYMMSEQFSLDNGITWLELHPEYGNYDEDEVDPFSAELAADLNCTERDVYEYAVDSVGASGIQTVEGCHSAGLHSCYGELWLCQECGNFFCDAEGSDDGFIDFCDECWAKMQGEAK